MKKRKEFLLNKINGEFPLLNEKYYDYIDCGFDHDIIILNKEIVFRFPKEVPKDLQSGLYDEIQLLSYLKKKIKVGIPEYTHISKDRSFAGYKMLKGKELKPLIFRRFTTSTKERFAKQLADFLTKLHSSPKSVINRFNVRISDPNKNHQKLVYNTKKFLFPRFNKREIKVIEAFFDELNTAINNISLNVLVHNDLTWEHIIWDRKKKQVNIIDFSDRSFGDPAIDFAGLWEFGNKLTNRVYALYHGKKDKKLLYRSQLYFKIIPLLVMKDALDGFPCTFKEGHKMLKQRFKL